MVRPNSISQEVGLACLVANKLDEKEKIGQICNRTMLFWFYTITVNKKILNIFI